MRLSEIDTSRRGFLKGVGAAAVVATTPAQTVKSLVSTLTKSMSPTNIDILSELLAVSDITALKSIFDGFHNLAGLSDLLTSKEMSYLENKYGKFDHNIHDDDDENNLWSVMQELTEKYGSELPAITQMLGRPPTFMKFFDIFEKHGIASFKNIKSSEENAIFWDTMLDWFYDSEIENTVHTLVDQAESAKLSKDALKAGTKELAASVAKEAAAPKMMRALSVVFKVLKDTAFKVSDTALNRAADAATAAKHIKTDTLATRDTDQQSLAAPESNPVDLNFSNIKPKEKVTVNR